MAKRRLSDAEYRLLFDFRSRLLRFLRASDVRIREAGLTPSQYLLLLGVRASIDTRGPTVGDMAEFLVLRHHSVVALVDRVSAAGLIRRTTDADDGRVVRLSLTAEGARRLERVASVNFGELEGLELLRKGLQEADGPPD